jgi:uncharacterized membrane protein YhfC
MNQVMPSVSVQLEQMYQNNLSKFQKAGVGAYFLTMKGKIEVYIASGNILDTRSEIAHFLLAANEAKLTDRNIKLINELSEMKVWLSKIEAVMQRMLQPAFNLKVEINQLIQETRVVVIALNIKLAEPKRVANFSAHIAAITDSFYPVSV